MVTFDGLPIPAVCCFADDLTQPPTKRTKSECVGSTSSSACDPVKRKQVDAHVQAFLRAVLDRATVSSAAKPSNERKSAKSRRDAATQTDDGVDLFDDPYAQCPDRQPFELNGNGPSFQPTVASHSFSELLVLPQTGHIPNREMYSQETMQLASQQSIYHNEAQNELSTGAADLAQYFTSCNSHTSHPDDPLACKRMSSTEVRKVINEWVEKYEQWFYQNFGIDVKTASVTNQNGVGNVSIPSTVDFQDAAISSYGYSTVNNSVSSNQSAVVVSRPPVSYVVAEGSLCLPDNQLFSPYVSLLPSFYTSAAFPRIPQPSNIGASFGQTAPAVICPTAIPLMNVYQSPNVCFQPCTLAPQLTVCTEPVTHLRDGFTLISNSTHAPINLLGLHVQSDTPKVEQPQLTSEVVNDLTTEIQTSAMLAALSLPISNGGESSMGQWGPPLRYGTYGRLPSAGELEHMDMQKVTSRPRTSSGNMPSNISQSQSPSATSNSCPKAQRMPPPPPTFILMRRQAMVCALQAGSPTTFTYAPAVSFTFYAISFRSCFPCAHAALLTILNVSPQLSCRDRARDIFLREKESRSGIKLDYARELDRLAESTIDLKPVYLFTKLNQLPDSERAYFLSNQSAAVESERVSIYGPHGRSRSWNPRILKQCFPVKEMYACDLLIGDVLIAEACATYKLQAQMCAARQAFRILSQPCFLVGSNRLWEGVEYLVLCLSPKAELVPQLPPFLSDPFESLSKKDRAVRPDQPEENFEVVNSKPVDDLWLFIARLPKIALDEDACIDRILARSAEFSQMTISFEVEVNMENGLFVCHALLDNWRYPPVSSSSLTDAQRMAAKELMTSLRKTQPIVGIHEDCADDPESSWGVPEWILVETPMWGKEEHDLAVELRHLEAHCEVPVLEELPETGDHEQPNLIGSANRRHRHSSAYHDPFTSRRHLDNYLQAYAASALVTPLRVPSSTVPVHLWPLLRQLASKWGLLSQSDFHPTKNGKTSALLICKRAPLPRLKRTLYERYSYGCFVLLDKGNLSDNAIKELLLADPLVYDTQKDVQNPSSLSPQSISCFLPSSCSPRTSSFCEDDPYSEEPVTRMARHFIATSSKPAVNVKTEPHVAVSHTVPTEDCVLVVAELNQPSNAIEILDDLPRTLIPGIDF
ncbi:uncharacterized protein DEA37_0012167 [Paragonimus westermani]|uniref:Uncharacterized protein n=1 Tax=Paragonimus westermani TaxID=34504 RepID=A0A5J4NKJ9_9TREM|nr:uncharacterized protein DEA37_0012167 [Paragonimus westermani]